eukprot:2965463-Prymnesium_polylepis.1
MAAAASPASAAVLSAGECAVVRFRSQGPTEFSILLLAPLQSGEKIAATDRGWDGDAGDWVYNSDD